MCKKLLCALIGVGISSAVFADTSDILATNNQFGVQAISTKVNYVETGDGRLNTQTGELDSESGTVSGGVALSYSMMQDLWLGNEYLAVEYDYTSGHTQYVGQTQAGGGYGSVVGSSSATLQNAYLRLGQGIELGSLSMLTPYLELGHHQWERGVNAGETYSHNYYGLGLMGQISPCEKLVLSANGLYGHTFDANITVNGSTGFSGALGDASMYQLGLSADYAITRELHANLGVDYTKFSYGASATYIAAPNYVWEPSSTTKYTTYKIGLAYAF